MYAVSVKELLPECGRIVAIRTPKGVTIGRYEVGRRGMNVPLPHWEDTNGKDIDNVTHWYEVY